MIIDMWVWVAFVALIIICLVFDLGFVNRKSKEQSIRKALLLTAFWIGLGLAFSVFVYFYMGSDDALKYLTGYVVEKSMSLDTLFVFMFVFSYFAVPKDYRHKVLFYGIVGALLFRALFILVGVELLMRFEILMLVFGIFLIYTAFKTVVRKNGQHSDINKNPMVRLFRRFYPVTDEYDGDRFFTVRNGVKTATPLVLALIALETTDIMFAVDSIPAILAISTDTFIVYTSNVFAMLGLRSLYFVLEGSLHSFRYLKYGLGSILAFVGVKILAANYVDVPVVFSLLFIVTAMAISIIASVIADRMDCRRTAS